MSRKVYVNAKVKLILTVDDDADIDDVVSQIEMVSGSDSGDLSDYEFKKWKITDSK